jgi:plasmid stability protein
MARMLQVRNLPDEVHEKLKARAADERMTLSDYVARELAKLVQYRTMSEIRADAERRLPRTDRETIMRAFDEAHDEEHPGWDEGLDPREY